MIKDLFGPNKNIKLDNLFDAISSVLQGRSLSLQLFGLPHKFSHRNYIYIYILSLQYSSTFLANYSCQFTVFFTILLIVFIITLFPAFHSLTVRSRFFFFFYFFYMLLKTDFITDITFRFVSN